MSDSTKGLMIALALAAISAVAGLILSKKQSNPETDEKSDPEPKQQPEPSPAVRDVNVDISMDPGSDQDPEATVQEKPVENGEVEEPEQVKETTTPEGQDNDES